MAFWRWPNRRDPILGEAAAVVSRDTNEISAALDLNAQDAGRLEDNVAQVMINRSYLNLHSGVTFQTLAKGHILREHYDVDTQTRFEYKLNGEFRNTPIEVASEKSLKS